MRALMQAASGKRQRGLTQEANDGEHLVEGTPVATGEAAVGLSIPDLVQHWLKNVVTCGQFGKNRDPHYLRIFLRNNANIPTHLADAIVKKLNAEHEVFVVDDLVMLHSRDSLRDVCFNQLNVKRVTADKILDAVDKQLRVQR